MNMSRYPKTRLWLIAACVLALLGLVILITGIALLVKADSKECSPARKVPARKVPARKVPARKVPPRKVPPRKVPPRKVPPRQETGEARCDFSKEANASGFSKFLDKVFQAYYQFFPYELAYKPGGVTEAYLRANFKPYDPSPAKLKEITTSSLQLLKELDDMKINTNKLKLREKKAMVQLKHFLKHIFATPYDGNYFAGDFLMGPNLFCWQPICSVGSHVYYNMRYFKPSTVQDVDFLQDKFKQLNETFSQYIENLRYGIRAGMVRSVEECIAGVNAMKQSYLNVFLKGDVGMYYTFFKSLTCGVGIGAAFL